jgi:nicotinate-nucleotide pyrophosphorylase (carboxylating)
MSPLDAGSRDFQFSEKFRDYLLGKGFNGEDLLRVIATALAEDLRYGPDATTGATVSAHATSVAELTPRVSGVVAGVPAALAAFDVVLDGNYEVIAHRNDGDHVSARQPVLVLKASTRGLLTAERTALNLICHLSGVATTTAEWVSTVEGTGCRIRDTRKTLPGMRLLQKYAVRCGGGFNHRMGLGDAILIKDNHVAAAGSVTKALKAARAQEPSLPCEVEVDTLDQLEEALAAGADEILLDNFTAHQCATAARRRDELAPKTKLEASGGLRIENAKAYAETGVDYLAVGALTHSASALDLGLDLR